MSRHHKRDRDDNRRNRRDRDRNDRFESRRESDVDRSDSLGTSSASASLETMSDDSIISGGYSSRYEHSKSHNRRDEREIDNDSITAGGHSNSHDESDHHDQGDDFRSDHDDQVRFTLSGGKVGRVQEYDDGAWKTERLEKGETWSFDGTNLIHQEREYGGLQTSTYIDSDGDGIFTKISEIYGASV